MLVIHNKVNIRGKGPSIEIMVIIQKFCSDLIPTRWLFITNPCENSSRELKFSTLSWSTDGPIFFTISFFGFHGIFFRILCIGFSGIQDNRNMYVCMCYLTIKVLHQLTWAPHGPEVQHLGFRGGTGKELQHQQEWFHKSAWGWCSGRPVGVSPGERGCPPHGHTWSWGLRHFAYQNKRCT